MAVASSTSKHAIVGTSVQSHATVKILCLNLQRSIGATEGGENPSVHRRIRWLWHSPICQILAATASFHVDGHHSWLSKPHDLPNQKPGHAVAVTRTGHMHASPCRRCSYGAGESPVLQKEQRPENETGQSLHNCQAESRSRLQYSVARRFQVRAVSLVKDASKRSNMLHVCRPLSRQRRSLLVVESAGVTVPLQGNALLPLARLQHLQMVSPRDICLSSHRSASWSVAWVTWTTTTRMAQNAKHVRKLRMKEACGFLN